MNTDDLVLKIILIGDSGVGKSCILKAFMGDAFKAAYTSTIGVDFEIKPIHIDGQLVNLHLWDTAGQERFRTITTSYYRSADAILLVFDLTDEKTFLNLETWMEDVRLYSSSAVEIMCIGNKCDLEAERGVDFEDAMSYCEKNRFLYFETSAKTHVNIDKALTKLTQIVYAKKIKSLQQNSKPSSQDHARRPSNMNANQSSAKGVSLKTAEHNNNNNNSSPCLC